VLAHRIGARTGRRHAFDLRKAHGPGANRCAQLDALDLDIGALARPYKDIVELVPDRTARVGTVRNRIVA
jgi:hypothetical protein